MITIPGTGTWYLVYNSGPYWCILPGTYLYYYFSRGSWLVYMVNERLPKRVMFGEVDGGKGYSRGQQQDWMGCLERVLTLFNLPTEAKHGRWQRRSRVSGPDSSRKRHNSKWSAGSLLRRIVQQNYERLRYKLRSTTSLKPRPGEGRKRSRAEGGVATAARLGRSKNVKETAEAWHWPSFWLGLLVTAAYCRFVTTSVLCLLCCPVP